MESLKSLEDHLTNLSTSSLPIVEQTIFNDKSDSNLNKKSSRQTRPSASKKYPGQIMLGIGKLALNLFQFSDDPYCKKLLDIVLKEIMGKNKEEYKINTVEKIRSYFVVEEEDDIETREVKLRFKALILNFFQDKYYNYWINNLFKGTPDNKAWYALNKICLEDKILYNKRVHFFIDSASSPYEMGKLTVDDPLDEVKKKVKKEECEKSSQPKTEA